MFTSLLCIANYIRNKKVKKKRLMIYLNSKVLVKQPGVSFLLFTNQNGTLSILTKKTGCLGKKLSPNLLPIF